MRRRKTDLWLEFMLGLHDKGELGTGCVTWPYATQGAGYAVMSRGRRAVKVSHYVLERTGRPRPGDPANHALHSCDKPDCLQPAHLRWGTHAENMGDRDARGRY